ncbi:MAG: serine/threonine-protein kinase, partial [Gemmatimonadota bacterium]
HRDIKPGNILTSGAHSLVTDFGVAKALSAAMPTAGMTSSGMAIGTPAYMAPEQLAADPAADQRVDIYAVGLLAYELLSGESPFVGASPTATMAAQLTRDPAPIETVRPDVPAALSQLIMHCLAKDPDRRPATAAALLAELEAIPIPSGATAATIPARRPAARSSRGWLAGAVGVALVATAAVGAVVVTARSREAAALAPERNPVVFTGDTTAGVALTPPATPVPARTVLTREDSLAIARAVRDRLDMTAPAKARGSAAASATPVKDAAIERKLVDSIVRASLAEWSRPGWVGAANAELGKIPRYAERMQSLGRFETLHVPMPPMRTGPRRVVITEPRENPAHPELANVGTAVAERLRDLLRGRKEYAITDPNAVREVLQRTREIAQVAQALGADVIASIDLIPVPGDSVVMLVKIRDLSSEPAYSYRVAGGATMAIADLPPAIDRTANATVRYIDEMSNAPRRMTRVVMVPSGPREGSTEARKPNE